MSITEPTGTIGEAEVDNRRRISLAKAGVAENARFIIERSAEGIITLIPVESVPAVPPVPPVLAAWTTSVPSIPGWIVHSYAAS